MSLLQAYLRNPRTQRVLSRKPGEKGFSLIELVVVIAVLAVLIVIALPNFQGVTDDSLPALRPMHRCEDTRDSLHQRQDHGANNQSAPHAR